MFIRGVFLDFTFILKVDLFNCSAGKYSEMNRKIGLLGSLEGFGRLSNDSRLRVEVI